MKIIKKFLNIFLVLMLFSASIFVPEVKVDAKTLGDLKKELAEMEANYKSNQQSKNLTEQQINTARSEINAASAEIENSQTEIKNLNDEIEKLTEEIKNKEEEIREFIRYYQLSNGESAYLEYVFGAVDYTDFIYRLAITEQLTKYNDNLVKKYNETIEQNKKNAQTLADKQVELSKKQDTLAQKIENLGSELAAISDESISIEEEIKMQKEAIDYYQNQLKCKDTESLSTCGRDQLPANTAFFRPITSGYVTSEFGQRTFDFHYGVDLSTTADKAPVYAAASGVVITVMYKTSCGGTRVYIHHNVNGQMYTTSYGHLREALVSKGDRVTTNTQIGIMGGNPNRETWDKCSTGQHVHFVIANGLYLKDYMYWSTFLSKSFNPRNLVNLPSGKYNWFYNRTTKY